MHTYTDTYTYTLRGSLCVSECVRALPSVCVRVRCCRYTSTDTYRWCVFIHPSIHLPGAPAHTGCAKKFTPPPLGSALK